MPDPFFNPVFLCSYSLRENSIGVEGAKNMAQALQENNTLQELEWVTSLKSAQNNYPLLSGASWLYSKEESSRLLYDGKAQIIVTLTAALTACQI